MKKLFLGIMCIMLVAGCTTTNDKKVVKSSTDQVQEVKKVDEQKTAQQQNKTVEKKKETEDKKKTETVKKEEKKDNQKKTTSQKTTTKKKSDSTKKKTNTTKKKTTKKKTTPQKKNTNNINVKSSNDYTCVQCGYHCKTEKGILKHLKEYNHSSYGIGYERIECPNDWILD